MLLDAMMMEARKGLMERERDQFSVSIRVMAVNNDHVCLNVMKVILQHCQYHVTLSSMPRSTFS